MASVISLTATLSCASTIKIPMLSTTKSRSSSRCSNLIGPFTVLDAESVFLAKILRKLEPYGISSVHFFQQRRPLVVCVSHFVARYRLALFSQIFISFGFSLKCYSYFVDLFHMIFQVKPWAAEIIKIQKSDWVSSL